MVRCTGSVRHCQNAGMSAELIGILSVGVGLGGLVLALQVRTDKRLDRIEAKMDKELGALRIELRQLGERVAQLGERVARIEGAALFRSADVPAQAPTGD